VGATARASVLGGTLAPVSFGLSGVDVGMGTATALLHPLVLLLLWMPVARVRADGGLCAQTRALTSNGWTNAELVEFWQAQVGRGSRLRSPLNRPQLVAALARSPTAVPNQLISAVPKERLTARMNLNAVNKIDEKGRSFEGDGELRLHWSDERLCFNSSQWAPTPDEDCHCPEPKAPRCTCVILRGEDMGNFTSWMWVPSSMVKALQPRGNIGTGGSGSYFHQEQRLIISSEGNVTWHRRFVEDFPAKFDESKMPFDQQTLSIRIGKGACRTFLAEDSDCFCAADDFDPVGRNLCV
jgi:hypothetical protein